MGGVEGAIEFPNASSRTLCSSAGRTADVQLRLAARGRADEITHVIRGDDHISNTPKQINVIRALGAELPVYAHVPNVLGPDGKKLSSATAQRASTSCAPPATTRPRS